MNEENAKKLLFDLDETMRQVGIPFFLYAGTCLGAVRDKKFVSVDLDIDIGCLSENFLPKKQELAESLITSGFKIEIIDHRHLRPWDGTWYAIKVYKYGEHADIVSFMKKGNYRWNPSHIDVPIFAHKSELLENYEPIEFYGRTFNVPKNPELFLAEHYGDDWEIPAREFWWDIKRFKKTAKFPRGEDDYWWSNE